MDYSIFDTLIDAVFVLDQDRKIHYANEAGANLMGIPLKRIKPGQKPLSEYLTFDDTNLFCMPGGTWGETEATPWKELTYKSHAGQEGKTQIIIQPDPNSTEKRWIIFLKDVSLEQALHVKYRAELAKKEKVIEELRIAQEELEKYSKNLEIMVEQRTSELNDANRILNAMVNSLGQGFLVFDSKGIVHPTYSRAAETFFQTKPGHKPIWEVLKVDREKLDNFRQWSRVIFEEFIPFNDLVKLGPKTLDTSTGLHISLAYNPIRDDSGKIVGVVLVATDETREIEAKRMAERERQYARMVIKLTKNKHHVHLFFSEAKALLNSLHQQASKPVPNLHEIFRAVHTLKGGASIFNMTDFTKAAHEYESVLSDLRNAPETEKTKFLPHVKPMVAKLEGQLQKFVSDHLYLIGADVFSDDRSIENSLRRLNTFAVRLAKVPLAQDLKEDFVEEFIKEPISSCFSHFDDLVQQAAELLRKRVKPIVYHGEDLRIYSDHYNELVSALVHAFRNAVDHGIEPPEERQMIGKDPAGSIVVSFEKDISGPMPKIRITIEDDGRGIDPDIIRKKLKKNGAPFDADMTPDFEILQHVFSSGFTSREQVTMLSGRGVGLDAVKIAAQNLGGDAQINSIKGQGTTLMILVPEILSTLKKAA